MANVGFGEGEQVGQPNISFIMRRRPAPNRLPNITPIMRQLSRHEVKKEKACSGGVCCGCGVALLVSIVLIPGKRGAVWRNGLIHIHPKVRVGVVMDIDAPWIEIVYGPSVEASGSQGSDPAR